MAFVFIEETCVTLSIQNNPFDFIQNHWQAGVGFERAEVTGQYFIPMAMLPNRAEFRSQKKPHIGVGRQNFIRQSDTVVGDKNNILKIVAAARVGAAPVKGGKFGGEHIFDWEKANVQIGGYQLSK